MAAPRTELKLAVPPKDSIDNSNPSPRSHRSYLNGSLTICNDLGGETIYTPRSVVGNMTAETESIIKLLFEAEFGSNNVQLCLGNLRVHLST